MNNIKVSIIIPVYNASLYLRECLDSVVTQTLDKYEIVCVDDCSTDNSRVILNEYRDKYPSIINIYSTNENSGQARARNIGLNYANGSYVFFMDSDDCFADVDVLKRIYEAVKENGVDGVFFDSLTMFETDELEKQYKLCGGKEVQTEGLARGIYTGRRVLESIYSQVDVSATVWRQFWKKEYLYSSEWLRFMEDTSPSEDFLFTFCAMIFAEKILYIPEVMYKYRLRENSSTTGKYNLKRYLSHVKCYNYGLKFLNTLDTSMRLNRVVAYYFKALLRDIRNNQYELSKEGCLDDYFGKNAYNINDLIVATIATEGYTYIDRLLTSSEYRLLKNASDIIIYGAGKVGKEVARLLEEYDIRNYVHAVTSNDAVGNGIMPLSKFENVKDTAVVILAASRQHKADMMKKINDIGFKQVMCLNDAL